MPTAAQTRTRRATGRLADADAGTWAHRLLAGYELGLIGAGIFGAGIFGAGIFGAGIFGAGIFGADTDPKALVP
jgi:hypothetical protein